MNFIRSSQFIFTFFLQILFKSDEIVQIGYEYAKPLVEEWAEENGYGYTK